MVSLHLLVVIRKLMLTFFFKFQLLKHLLFQLTCKCIFIIVNQLGETVILNLCKLSRFPSPEIKTTFSWGLHAGISSKSPLPATHEQLFPPSTIPWITRATLTNSMCDQAPFYRGLPVNHSFW